MNLSEINWDFNEAGTWPLPVKAAATLLVCAVVMGGGFYFDTSAQLETLESTEQKERELKHSLETKQKKAVNLPEYQNQLAQIEASLDEMIRQMPTEEEVASLLVDISQTGLATGLEFKLFKPDKPISKEFYSELPINIEVTGKYKQLGIFMSGLAALPRIVTVHDVSIAPEKKLEKKDQGKDKDKGGDGTMLMKAIVKTYNESTEVVKESVNPKKKRGGK
ncbi:MAG: type 4a pilus biogenesis protein PilO [Methylococcaceae bacterium]